MQPMTQALLGLLPMTAPIPRAGVVLHFSAARKLAASRAGALGPSATPEDRMVATSGPITLADLEAVIPGHLKVIRNDPAGRFLMAAADEGAALRLDAAMQTLTLSVDHDLRQDLPSAYGQSVRNFLLQVSVRMGDSFHGYMETLHADRGAEYVRDMGTIARDGSVEQTLGSIVTMDRLLTELARRDQAARERFMARKAA